VVKLLFGNVKRRVSILGLIILPLAGLSLPTSGYAAACTVTGTTGEILWSTELGRGVFSGQPAIDGNVSYIASFLEDSTLYKLQDSGEIIWQKDIGLQM
jgi:hypothetical protein